MEHIAFYCKMYCLVIMFQAPLCPSSGALELYRWLLPVVLGCLVYGSLVWYGAVGYVSGQVWSCGLCVRFVGCRSTRDGVRNMLTKQSVLQLKKQCVASSWPFISTYVLLRFKDNWFSPSNLFKVVKTMEMFLSTHSLPAI